MALPSDPIVTVCMPCYNHNQFVAEAVESVMQQDVDGLCLILSDDGSTDNSAEKCIALKNKYSDVIDLILHEKNVGLRANLKSIEDRINPQTKYLIWFSADDIFLPGKLKKQMDFLDHNSDYIACYHDVSVSDGMKSYNYNHPGYGQKAYAGDITDKLIERGCFVSGLSMMIRWDAAVNLTQNLDVGHSTDWLYYIGLSMFGKIGYLDEVLGVYRRHSGNMTKQDVLESYYTLVYDYLLRKYPILKPQIERGLCRADTALIVKALILRKSKVFSACSKGLLKRVYRNPKMFFYCIKMLAMMIVQRTMLLYKNGGLFR